MNQYSNNTVEKFITNNSKLCIIMIYNIVTLMILAIFYPLIPVLMGYAPDFLEVSIALGSSYNMQYIIVAVFTILIGTIFLMITLSGIEKWKDINLDSELDTKRICSIREKCINLPYVIYVVQLTFINIPFLALAAFICIMNKVPMSVIIRVITIVFSLFSLAAVISHTFAKRVFTRILLKMPGCEVLVGKRISIKTKIFLQVLPMIIIAVLFTGTLGYSRLIEEKGNILFDVLKEHMEKELTNIGVVEGAEQLIEALSRVKYNTARIEYFIVTPKGELLTSDEAVPSRTFSYYIDNPYKGNRIFGDTNELQGIAMKIEGVDGIYTAGIKFEVTSEKTITYFMFGLVTFLIVIILILNYLANTLMEEISHISLRLTEIADKESVGLEKKVSITTNDEIGDLVIAYNKIQERERALIKEIEDNHEILIEQERLASLGHLMGGIAHNMRTPIMSISGAIEGLRDLISEYEASINDPTVTQEDHKEIIMEMSTWTDKMKSHCSYMNDIIAVIKGQIQQSNTDVDQYFTIEELLKCIELLISHELKEHQCNIVTNAVIDLSTKIKGDMSALIQILSNLILNAIDAYEDRGGRIELTVFNCTVKEVIFLIKDYANGIPLDVRGKLFNQMITTKGKKGTGLGLYISYSNLIANFGGRMWFKSEEGHGTEFFVAVPTFFE